MLYAAGGIGGVDWFGTDGSLRACSISEAIDPCEAFSSALVSGSITRSPSDAGAGDENGAVGCGKTEATDGCDVRGVGAIGVACAGAAAAVATGVVTGLPGSSLKTALAGAEAIGWLAGAKTGDGCGGCGCACGVVGTDVVAGAGVGAGADSGAGVTVGAVMGADAGSL